MWERVLEEGDIFTENLGRGGGFYFFGVLDEKLEGDVLEWDREWGIDFGIGHHRGVSTRIVAHYECSLELGSEGYKT